jgi:Leucine-rich repeat (LRR) protein
MAEVLKEEENSIGLQLLELYVQVVNKKNDNEVADKYFCFKPDVNHLQNLRLCCKELKALVDTTIKLASMIGCEMKSLIRCNWPLVNLEFNVEAELPDGVCEPMLAAVIKQFPLLEDFILSGEWLNLKKLPDSIRNLKELSKLSLDDARNLTVDGILPLRGNRKLKTLQLFTSQEEINKLPEFIVENIPSLEHLTVGGSVSSLPESLGKLTQLLGLDLSCRHLEVIPESIGELCLLTTLTVAGSQKIKSFPEAAIAKLTELRRFMVSDTPKLQTLPESLSSLKQLVYVSIWMCPTLTEFPASFEEWTIERLTIARCRTFSHLPDSIGNLKSLKSLIVIDCQRVQSVPDSLTRLSSLVELKIQGYPMLTPAVAAMMRRLGTR